MAAATNLAWVVCTALHSIPSKIPASPDHDGATASSQPGASEINECFIEAELMDQIIVVPFAQNTKSFITHSCVRH